MINCMMAMGRAYKEEQALINAEQAEKKLLEKLVSTYYSEDNTDEMIRANDIDNEWFLSLENEYKAIQRETDKNETENIADALMLYISSGLLRKLDGCYFIDNNKLKKYIEAYNISDEEKAVVYKKGTKN